MNKKSLLTALLALGLVLTGCNGDGDKKSTSTSAPNPNVVERVEGNGTSWPTEVQTLIDKATAHSVDPEGVPLPFVSTAYYSAAYNEDTANNIQYVTEVICENNESITREEAKGYMDLYTDALVEAGYDIDKSEYNTYRTYYAQKLIKGNEYFVVNYGITSLSYNEETYESFDAFYILVGFIKTVARNGWYGDELKAWPTQGIIDATGKDIPHPSFETRDGISLFGGYNTLPATNTDGSEMLLDCYILWFWGTTSDDLATYAAELNDLYWSVDSSSDADGVYYVGFNMLNQTVIEFFFMEQAQVGSGVLMFIYINNPDAVMEEASSWPTEVSYLPEYTEDGKTLSYFYTQTLAGYALMDVLIVGGVSENAAELYAAQLEALGCEVSLETDPQDPTFQYYYAFGDFEAMFYMDVCPGVGHSLIIQSIGY